MKPTIQFFEQIKEDSHPAISYVLAFMEAQTQKKYENLRKCFGTNIKSPIFINLPGGVIFRSVEELLQRHKAFYESPLFSVERSQLQDGIGNEVFFICSVLVDVTLPDGHKRANYIDMTFIPHEEKPLWIPVRLINTVIESQ